MYNGIHEAFLSFESSSKTKPRIAVLLKGASKEIVGTVVSSVVNEGFILKTDSGVEWRVPADCIGPWHIEDKPANVRKFPLIFCKCPETKCPGVQMISSNENLKQADYDKFMNPCPCRCAQCRTGHVPDFRIVPDSVAGSVFAGILLGEYPEKA